MVSSSFPPHHSYLYLCFVSAPDHAWWAEWRIQGWRQDEEEHVWAWEKDSKTMDGMAPPPHFSQPTGAESNEKYWDSRPKWGILAETFSNLKTTQVCAGLSPF